MAVQTYKKTDKIQLSKNFSSREFRCGLGRPCSCTTTLIDPQLVTYLQKIWDYRCGGVYLSGSGRTYVDVAAWKRVM